MMPVLTDFIQEQVKRSADIWDQSLKNTNSYSKHQESDLKEQDQELKINARWSVDWWSRIRITARLSVLENTQESGCFTSFVYRILCTIYAKFAYMNHLHKERIFLEKHDTLSHDQGLRSVYQLFLHKNTYLLSYLNFLNFVNF